MPNNNSIRQYLVVNFVLVKTPTVVTSCGTIRAIMEHGTGYTQFFLIFGVNYRYIIDR